MDSNYALANSNLLGGGEGGLPGLPNPAMNTPGYHNTCLTPWIKYATTWPYESNK
jgi:hypothetical protein